jgi:hypothetical protein
MPCSKYYNAPSSTLDTSTPFKYCNASPSSPDVSACEAMMMMMVRGRNAIWVPRFLPLSLLKLGVFAPASFSYNQSWVFKAPSFNKLECTC